MKTTVWRRARRFTLGAPAPIAAAAVSVLILTRGLTGIDAVPMDQVDPAIRVSIRSEDDSGRGISSCAIGTGTDGTASCGAGAATPLLSPGEWTAITTRITNHSESASVLVALVPGRPCTTVAARPRSTGVPDICSRISVSVAVRGTTVAQGTLRALSTKGAVRLAALRPGSTLTASVAVRLDQNLDNTYQGLTAHAQMQWSFTQE